jgi:hypothetical protein
VNKLRSTDYFEKIQSVETVHSMKTIFTLSFLMAVTSALPPLIPRADTFDHCATVCNYDTLACLSEHGITPGGTSLKLLQLTSVPQPPEAPKDCADGNNKCYADCQKKFNVQPLPDDGGGAGAEGSGTGSSSPTSSIVDDGTDEPTSDITYGDPDTSDITYMDPDTSDPVDDPSADPTDSTSSDDGTGNSGFDNLDYTDSTDYSDGSDGTDGTDGTDTDTTDSTDTTDTGDYK